MRRLRRLLLLSLAASGLAASVEAAPPNQSDVQLYLTDMAGVPLLTSVDVQIDLYADATGGSPLYSEIHLNEQPERGVVTLRLGQGNVSVGQYDPLLLSQPRHVEFTLDGEAMAPRLALNEVPWALHAANVTTALDTAALGGLPATGLQRRISQACAVGESIQSIAADGSVVCAADLGAGSDITSVVAGDGLSGGGLGGDVVLEIAPNVVLGRVAASCPPGQAIRSIENDGAVSCVDDLDEGGMITEVLAGDGIRVTASGASRTVSVVAGTIELASDAVGGSEIANGSILEQDIGDGAIRGAELKPIVAVRFDCGGDCDLSSFSSLCAYVGPGYRAMAAACDSIPFDPVASGGVDSRQVGSLCLDTSGVDGVVYCIED